jgi:hypothetical protein
VRLSPLGTSAIDWPIVPAPDVDDECGAVGGMRISKGKRSTRTKPAPVPLCPPQIPHDLTWARTRAAEVGSGRLTAWAMAGPGASQSCDLHRKRHTNAKKISDRRWEKNVSTHRIYVTCTVFSLPLSLTHAYLHKSNVKSVRVSCNEFAVTPIETPLHSLPVPVDTRIAGVLNPVRTL